MKKKPYPLLCQTDYAFALKTVVDWSAGCGRPNSAEPDQRRYSAAAARWFLDGFDGNQLISNLEYEKYRNSKP